MNYSLAHLVDALVDRERYHNANPALAEYMTAKARALEQAFGINLSSNPKMPKEQRRLLYLLERHILVLANLKSPFDGILEGSVALPGLEKSRLKIDASIERMREECKTAMEIILRAVYPDSPTHAPTSEELAALGFDDRNVLAPEDYP